MRLQAKLKFAAAVSMLMAGTCAPSWAVDSVSFEGGVGDRVQMARVGVQWNWDQKWLQSNGSHVGGYWDLTLAEWRQARYQNVSGSTRYLTNIGFMPVFRWQKDSRKGLYLEGGVGVNLFSELYNNNDRKFSTAFQFSEHVGVGYVFDNKWDVSLKAQHFSNASIKKPNPGENFVVLGVKYSF